jgi:hypothetical protein
MPLTYEPIATTTLSSTTNTITFSSISSTYTDLRISFFGRASSGYIRTRLRFNGDTAGNYGWAYLGGTRLSVQASSSTGITYISSDLEGITPAQPSFYSFDIFSYAGSTKKTSLSTCSEDKNTDGRVSTFVSVWNSTAAINSVTIIASESTFAVGTIATLYGIKAA